MELTPDPTVDDLEKLPDHGFRYELHEGNLLILSPATAWHFKAIMRLVTALSRAGRPVSGAVGIKVWTS
ncbi:Uma2 family endonuclease [Allorhizocola rhizosphaerae]|uniref:Uma2 family endonuclease n=1 Tax=Allorhizocola rhizosphaerae TaxID=1872709 RepID=UPI000E3D518F|nr:Uma2 family endonuclease [Allorhizocola rhizosphaerae]